MASITLRPRQFADVETCRRGSAAVEAMEATALREVSAARGPAECFRLRGRFEWRLDGRRSSKLAVAQRLASELA